MKKIAIIGSGISGLTCAHLLDQHHDVTIFEKNNYVGGHTATVDVDLNGTSYAIDTGFIVFNDRTYPYFNQLLSSLGIERQETEMSFSVHNTHTKFEYNGHGLNSLFAQRRNLLRPSFWRLILDILRFNKQCKSLYQQGDIPADLKLGEFLTKNHFSQFFIQHYVLPMGAAIWSTSLSEMEKFELRFFIQFFYNHGLLNIADRPQWFVVPGGSREYVKIILEQLKKPVATNSSIQGISRTTEGVYLDMIDGERQRFDDVIFACHSDQALALLSDPTEDEKRILGSIPYSRNDVILHTDTSLLPDRKLAWASWNYMLDGDQTRPACVTYYMNLLQGVESDTTFCVTLNQTDKVDPNKILKAFVYDHPVLDSESVAAQKQRDMINGNQHCYFVGAYWYNGFHEDGVRSALDVTKQFGASL